MTESDVLSGTRLYWPGAERSWEWIVAGMISLVLIGMLYRAERRLVSSRVGYLLVIARLVSAILLAAFLAEPAIVRNRSESAKGVLYVGVDHSESMSVIDSDRSDGRDRLSRALDLLAGPLATLSSDHDVKARRFAKETGPAVSIRDLVETARTSETTPDADRLATDWGPVLDHASATLDDEPVSGVLLITDGRTNAADEDANRARIERLSKRGIPIHAIYVGSHIPPKDLAIASLRAPETVFKGDSARIDALIKTDGLSPGAHVTVSLEVAGDPSKTTAQVVEVSKNSRTPVSFRLPSMDRVGLASMSLAISPLPGDVRPDNDRREFSLNVTDDKTRVLILDGEPRWEFRYLRNALTRDPLVAAESVLFRQPRLETAEGTTYPSMLPEKSRARNEGSDLINEFDAIVIGDVSATELNHEIITRLDMFVSERGGTLIFLPGPRNWPGLLAAHPEMRALLPIVDPTETKSATSASVSPAPSLPNGSRLLPTTTALDDAGAWPMIALGDDVNASRLIWENLPRLPWSLSGAPKPVSTVLATTESDPERAVLAAHSYGLGKVIWIGVDSTWRWRFRVGDVHHHRFWGRLARWAASNRLSAGNRFIRYGLSRSRASVGDRVSVTARVSEEAGGVESGVLLAASVHDARSKERVALIPMSLDAARFRMFEGDLPALPAGSYVVRLEAPSFSSNGVTELEPEPATEARLEISLGNISETVELASSRDELERLAAATGGRVVDESAASEIPPLLRSAIKPTTKSEESPLWNHPVIVAILFGLLTAEWMLRKRVGLP